MFAKAYLRLFCRMHSDEKVCNELLKNSEKLNFVHEHLHAEYQAQASANGGKFMDFFQWLVSNKTEILSLITTIIALFPK